MVSVSLLLPTRDFCGQGITPVRQPPRDSDEEWVAWHESLVEVLASSLKRVGASVRGSGISLWRSCFGRCTRGLRTAQENVSEHHATLRTKKNCIARSESPCFGASVRIPTPWQTKHLLSPQSPSDCAFTRIAASSRHVSAGGCAVQWSIERMQQSKEVALSRRG
jgi:hypothetical protein